MGNFKLYISGSDLLSANNQKFILMESDIHENQYSIASLDILPAHQGANLILD